MDPLWKVLKKEALKKTKQGILLMIKEGGGSETLKRKKYMYYLKAFLILINFLWHSCDSGTFTFTITYIFKYQGEKISKHKIVVKTNAYLVTNESKFSNCMIYCSPIAS